jgi:cobyrinic acid a,c-diamide synthase
MRAAIAAASSSGMPIYAECGGFMYLCRSIEDAAGNAEPMCGCFPFQVRMNEKMAALGYREVRLKKETPIGGAGAVLRGHEFRFSSLVDETAPVDGAYRVSDGLDGSEKEGGFQVGSTLGSYIHLHFGSCPAAAGRFVDSCRRYKGK